MSNYKMYTIKVTCEYYVVVEALSEGEAIMEAIKTEYSVNDLQNFHYEIDTVY